MSSNDEQDAVTNAEPDSEGPGSGEPGPERSDILDILAFQRMLLMSSVDSVSDDQARERTTVSELTLGGIIKHLVETEASWMDFVEHGPARFGGGKSFDEMGPADFEARANNFRLLPTETLAGIVEAYQQVAARTDALVRSVDLDQAHPLPAAPWFPPGATRSNRRVFLGMVSELAQHTGHADIIREALDGKKSMG